MSLQYIQIRCYIVEALRVVVKVLCRRRSDFARWGISLGGETRYSFKISLLVKITSYTLPLILKELL